MSLVSLWTPHLGMLLIWCLTNMLGVNSPLTAGGTGASQWLDPQMPVSSLGTILISIARGWLAGPSIWNWVAQNYDFLQCTFFWEALLAEFPAPSWLMGFSVEWLAPWQLGGVTLVQGPLLHSCGTDVRLLCWCVAPTLHVDLYHLQGGGISLHPSKNLNCSN